MNDKQLVSELRHGRGGDDDDLMLEASKRIESLLIVLNPFVIAHDNMKFITNGDLEAAAKVVKDGQ